jgi:hypothetical protein
MRPVSTRVNTVANDDAACIEAAPEPDRAAVSGQLNLL